MAGLNILGVLFYLTGIHEDPGNWPLIAIAGGLISILVALYLLFVLRFEWLSAPFVYLMLFWLFHFGLLFPTAIQPDILFRLPGWALFWLDQPTLGQAVVLAILAFPAFVLGAALAARPLPRNGVGIPLGGETPPLPSRGGVGVLRAAGASYEPGSGNRVVFRVGMVLAAIGLFLFSNALFGAGGLRFITGPYAQLWELPMVLARLRGFGKQLLEYGLVLALAGARRDRLWLPLALALAVSGIDLTIGSRGPALVPLVTYFVLLGKRGMRLPRSLVLLGIAFLLFLIPLVRQIRQVGVAQYITEEGLEMPIEVIPSSAVPIETITEMGASIRPVVEITSFVLSGDDYIYGASYLLAIQLILPTTLGFGIQFIDLSTQPAALGVMIAERVGAIGFSPVAEAYYNFGMVGVLIFFVLLGYVLGWLDRKAWSSAYSLAVLGICLTPLLWEIRNIFQPVPRTVVWGLLLLGFCKLLERAGHHPARLGPTARRQ